MIRLTIVALSMVFLFGCEFLPTKLGTRKLFAGTSGVSSTEGSHIHEIRYRGKKNETLDKAFKKWQKAAEKQCKGYRSHSRLLGSPSFVAIDTEVVEWDNVYLYFMEEGKNWPQAIGLIECP